MPILVVPVDLPFVTPAAIDALVDGCVAAGPAVVLVTDRHGTGTNALGLRPPDVIDFAFGPGSRAAHRERAAAAGARYVELDGPLAHRPRHARGPGPRSNRPTPERARVPADRPMPGVDPILALEGIPEIRLGDDLAALIGDAIERTPGVLPLARDDVLVVTQKIVSKAEGAVVDLDDGRAATRGDRVRGALRPRPAPGRGRPARGPPGRPDGRTACSSPRRRTGSSAPTAASTRRTSGPTRAPS